MGHYGDDCKPCGMCHEGRQCDMVTGHCDNCSLGYQPPYCNKGMYILTWVNIEGNAVALFI